MEIFNCSARCRLRCMLLEETLLSVYASDQADKLRSERFAGSKPVALISKDSYEIVFVLSK